MVKLDFVKKLTMIVFITNLNRKHWWPRTLIRIDNDVLENELYRCIVVWLSFRGHLYYAPMEIRTRLWLARKVPKIRMGKSF